MREGKRIAEEHPEKAALDNWSDNEQRIISGEGVG